MLVIVKGWVCPGCAPLMHATSFHLAALVLLALFVRVRGEDERVGVVAGRFHVNRQE